MVRIEQVKKGEVISTIEIMENDIKDTEHLKDILIQIAKKIYKDSSSITSRGKQKFPYDIVIYMGETREKIRERFEEIAKELVEHKDDMYAAAALMADSHNEIWRTGTRKERGYDW